MQQFKASLQMKVHKITAGFDYEKRPNEFLDLWDIVNQK